jgi:hypothetical protein
MAYLGFEVQSDLSSEKIGDVGILNRQGKRKEKLVCSPILSRELLRCCSL